MQDLLSVGNITVDLYFQGDSLTQKDDRFQLAIGGKYMASHLHSGLGGGGANVAVGVGKHRKKTAVAGLIGDNAFKPFILGKLKESGINTAFLGVEKSFMSISVIFLNDQGEKSVVHYSTPREHLIYHNLRLEDLKKFKSIYMGNLPEIPIPERVQILESAKRQKLTVFLNLGVNDCRRTVRQLKPFLAQADVIILNGHEFADLVKANYKDIHFHEDIVSWYIPNLINKIVVVTEGKKGSYSYCQGQVLQQKAIEVTKIVDTTGAGDAYTAGFISAYLSNHSLEMAMTEGAKYAAKKLGWLGANEA